MAFWRDKFSDGEIEFLLNKVRDTRKRNNDGRISVTGAGDFDGWLALLVSAIGWEVRTDALRIQIVKRIIFSPDLPQEFTQEEFRREAYRQLHNCQKEELKIFRVVFPIWNLPSFVRKAHKLGNVLLNFSPSSKTKVFKRIIRERRAQQTDEQFEEHFTADRLRDLQQCSICFAHVRASSPGDANEQASEALYETLGLVNLAMDAGKYTRKSFRVSGKLPVSDVLIGPHTTTHFEDGKLSHNGFWSEKWNGGPRPKNQNAKKLQVVENRLQRLVGGVAKSPWRDQCKSAATRYFKAFSNPNLEESFLDGWRLFENISGSRYEKIDRQLVRASNIFENNIEYLVIGRHLALRRNLLAHGRAINADDDETLAFQMLQFVVPFLERYILNGFDFNTPSDFWEFLDLPPQKADRYSERAKLLDRLELLDKAAQFRREDDW